MHEQPAGTLTTPDLDGDKGQLPEPRGTHRGGPHDYALDQNEDDDRLPAMRALKPRGEPRLQLPRGHAPHR
jgi:hypothetical protein